VTDAVADTTALDGEPGSVGWHYGGANPPAAGSNKCSPVQGSPPRRAPALSVTDGILAAVTTDLSWRSDWECGPAAHTIAEMVHGREVSDAETEVVYAWLVCHGNWLLDDTSELIRVAKAAWCHGHPWTANRIVDGVEQSEQLVGWSNAHEAARFRKAMEALFALVDKVRVDVTGGAAESRRAAQLREEDGDV
jgi:hypothetical protein